MDITKIKLASGLMPTIRNLMDLAEDTFGPKQGAKKRAWVTKALLELADQVDIPLIPAEVEHHLKEALIGLLIEALWGALFQAPRLRPSQVVSLAA